MDCFNKKIFKFMKISEVVRNILKKEPNINNIKLIGMVYSQYYKYDESTKFFSYLKDLHNNKVCSIQSVLREHRKLKKK